MVKEDLQELAQDAILDYLKNQPVTEKVKSGLYEFRKAQETLYNLAESDDESNLVKIRVGTTLVWEIVNRIAGGQNPKEFTKSDWANIANCIADKAINIDETEYSRRVFLTYADYIEASVLALTMDSEVQPSQNNINQIMALAQEIRDKSEALADGTIKEVDYIDACLWIALEAMVKILSTYLGLYACDEVRLLIDGAAIYAFEYARLSLYRQEQELLDYILEYQEELDVKLQEKYDAYCRELNEKTELFMSLIDGAFDEDIRSKLIGSVSLAKAAGVAEEEILQSVSDVDDFFM